MNLDLLLVDPHVIVRQGVRHLLLGRHAARSVLEAGTGAEALQLVDRVQFDVIVLAIALPDMNGLEALKRLKRRAPNTPVLILSAHQESQYVVRALRGGAAGYLPKTIDIEQLIEALQAAAAGRRYVSTTMAEALADFVSDRDAAPPHEKLSDREYQTLCMLAAGRRLTDIAENLSLSVKTVSAYRARLLDKMHLSTNAELTHYAIRHHLIEMPSALESSP
jgi:two-component system, NarL family, invasion response regulator UvrY